MTVAPTRLAVGLGARVTVFDRSVPRLRYLSDIFGNRIVTRYSSNAVLAEAITQADMVIGAVLVPGASAPKLVSKAQLVTMKRGAVLIDVAIDHGGCFETSRPTTHDKPTFMVDGIVHYCVTNMPGAVPLTASLALNHATLPFIKKIADLGLEKACASDNHLANGLNMANGEIRHPSVESALNS